MTTKDIINHLNSKPCLDHRISQLVGNITALAEEKKELEEIRRYVNQVTDVFDGVPIKIEWVRPGCLEARTITPVNEDHRWGFTYQRVDNDKLFGVRINGKAKPGMSACASTDNIYLGDRLVGFYNSEDEAREVLLDWVVRGISKQESI